MGGTTKQYNTAPQSTQRLRDPVIDYLMGGSSGFGTQGNGTGSPYDRINARTGTPTQSVDELGGANSAFFQNLMQRYQPAFDQARTLALAGAREGSGTLTGSGYANALGKTANRSFTDEGNFLTQIATHGLDLEAARQAQRYAAETGVNQNNASNFLQLLLGQSLAGVGPNSVVSKGGIGALLGPILQLGGMLLGRRGGGSPSPTGGGGTVSAPNADIYNTL